MRDTTVYVTAQLRARQDCLEALKRELVALVAPTRSEEGCISYELHQQPEQPEQFLFYERWQHKADLDRHLQQPHIAAFLKNTAELLAEPLQVTTWELVR